MKYNDRASVNFQQRSINKNDPYNFNVSDRRSRRLHNRGYKKETTTNMNYVLKHPLCAIMSIKEKVELYEEFKYGTKGNWSTHHQMHDFTGNFTEFIEYLKEKGDERINILVAKLRDKNIDSLLK